MGNEGTSPAQESVLDRVEKSKVYARDSAGEYIPIEVEDDGRLRVVLVSSDGAELTEALGSVDTDNLLTNLEEIGGQAQSAVDVADKIDKINEALFAQNINNGVSGTDVAIQTMTARALESHAGVAGPEDHLQTSLYGENDAGSLESLFSPSVDAGGDTSKPALQTQTLLNTLDSAGDMAAIGGQNINTGVDGGLAALQTMTARALESHAGVAGPEDYIQTTLYDQSGNKLDPLARQDTSPVTDSTTTAGNNATLVLGDYRKDADFFVDVSGAATLTVEVRTSGGTWRQFDTVDYGSSTTEVEQYSTAFAEIRASVDTNLNTLEGSAKGV